MNKKITLTINKAGYTALGALKHLNKRRRYGPMDGQTLLKRFFVVLNDIVVIVNVGAVNFSAASASSKM